MSNTNNNNFIDNFNKIKQRKENFNSLRRSLPDEYEVYDLKDYIMVKKDGKEVCIPSSHSPDIISNIDSFQQLLNSLVAYSPFDSKYDIFDSYRKTLVY